MRARYQPSRGMSIGMILLLLMVALGVGGTATVGGLVAAGVVELPFMAEAEPHKPTPAELGHIPIPRAATLIPANTVFTRDHIFDRKKGEITVVWMRAEVVPDDVLTAEEVGKYLGSRVLRHDKQPGFVFSESDFHPPGTRPGFIAQIPPGKQAMVLAADRIPGLQNLRVGDEFDLLGTMPVDLNKLSRDGQLAHAIWQQSVREGFGSLDKQTTVRKLARRGVVITPVTTRMTTTQSSSLVGGTTTKQKPVEEITIAVEPEEVTRLTQALALNAAIYCVAHSGRPEAAHIDEAAPEYDPLENVAAIETLKGPQRQLEIFGARRQSIDLSSPQPAAGAALSPVGQEAATTASDIHAGRALVDQGS